MRAYLEKKCAESKTTLNQEALDRIVKNELRTVMRDTNALSRMRNLFVTYHLILCRHGLSWLPETNPKVAVNHVLQAVRPGSLCTRLQSDISFGYYSPKSDFRAFMAHTPKLAQAS